MSHIFISYARNDKVYLDKLISWLHENGFAKHEVWYDQHIEGGNSWNDEISTALDESFAVIVIVTENLVKSVYCTYEWAYAIGQGIPILPLVFDEVRYADVPVPLASKQFIPCIESVPLDLKEKIRRLKSIPPQVAAINKRVYEAIYDTHRRFFILGWIGGLENIDPEERTSVLAYFIRKATEAHQILETLMVDKAFAFSGKQYRFCWKLIDLLQGFSELDRKVTEYFQERLFAQFESVWLPAFEYFEGDGYWREWVRHHFEWVSENDGLKTEVLIEIVKVFPLFLGRDAERLIQYKIHDLKRKKK